MNPIKLFSNAEQEFSLADSQDDLSADIKNTNPEFLIEVDTEGLKEILEKAPHIIRKINRLG